MVDKKHEQEAWDRLSSAMSEIEEISVMVFGETNQNELNGIYYKLHHLRQTLEGEQ